MKYKLTISIFSFFLFATNAYPQECDEATRARMIKSGISDKVIEEQCGKPEEEKIIQKNVENQTEYKTISEEELNVQRLWRFAAGSGSGTFKYTDSYYTALSGDFDHELSGGTFTLNYIKFKEDNFFQGGGWSSINVKGSETKSKDAIPGYWTYNHTTYGNFDITITVTSFRTNFFYGIFGYDVQINDQSSFQPNLRYGWKFVVAEWKEKIEWQYYQDQEQDQSATFHTFGLAVVLPFMYKIDNSYAIGADICICGSNGEASVGTSKYEFGKTNVFNIFFDIYL